MCLCVHVCACMCVCVRACVHMHALMHACVHVCMCGGVQATMSLLFYYCIWSNNCDFYVAMNIKIIVIILK